MTPTTEQLKDLLDKVTPGDWAEITPDGNLWPPRVFASESKFICMVDNSDDTQEQRINDATLIALGPTLAAEVVRLREALWRIDRLTEEAPFDFGLIRLIARQALDATSEK